MSAVTGLVIDVPSICTGKGGGTDGRLIFVDFCCSCQIGADHLAEVGDTSVCTGEISQATRAAHAAGSILQRGRVRCRGSVRSCEGENNKQRPERGKFYSTVRTYLHIE